MSSYVVKRGYCSVKEDGLRSFIWSKRWMLLREQTLTFHKNEVRDYRMNWTVLQWFIGWCGCVEKCVKKELAKLSLQLNMDSNIPLNSTYWRTFTEHVPSTRSSIFERNRGSEQNRLEALLLWSHYQGQVLLHFCQKRWGTLFMDGWDLSGNYFSFIC